MAETERKTQEEILANGEKNREAGRQEEEEEEERERKYKRQQQNKTIQYQIIVSNSDNSPSTIQILSKKHNSLCKNNFL